MDKQMIFEIIGYVASVVTAVSLTMKNIRRLRWLNLFGSAFFSCYGALIGAWPVFALNGFVAIVDVYYLISMSRRKEYFDIIEIDIKKSQFTHNLLQFYKDDIEKFFPKFKYDPQKTYKSYFCLRDMRPVGLVMFSEISSDELLVELDYTIPEYRDLKTGHYFYHEGLKRVGIDDNKKLIIKDPHEVHRKYLNAMGYKRTGDEGIAVYTYRRVDQ